MCKQMRHFSHVLTAFFILYIYQNVLQDNVPFNTSEAIFVFAHWREWPGCATGRQLTKVDRSGRTPTFSWHWPQPYPKTHRHPLSWRPVSNTFPSKITQNGLPGAHSCIPMTILRNLWKEQRPSSETLDVHQNPPFPTSAAPCLRPLCTRPSNCCAAFPIFNLNWFKEH